VRNRLDDGQINCQQDDYDDATITTESAGSSVVVNCSKRTLTRRHRRLPPRQASRASCLNVANPDHVDGQLRHPVRRLQAFGKGSSFVNQRQNRGAPAAQFQVSDRFGGNLPGLDSVMPPAKSVASERAAWAVDI